MHILFIPSWYPKTPDDISGCFFREQAIALARAGHQIGVLTFYTQLSLQLGLRSSLDEGVQTWRIHLFKGVSVYGKAILPFFCEFYFNRYCRLHGTPDVLHAQSVLNGGLLAMKLSRAHGIPYIVTEHSSAFPRQLMLARSLVAAKKIFDSANDVLAVSSMLAACLKEACALNKEIKVVPNILNEKIFKNVSAQRKSMEGEFLFLNIGLLTKIKGQDILIKAFTKEFRSRPVQLLIGGYGEAYDALHQLIVSLGMGSQIHLLGGLSREQVHQYMMQCNAFVLSSLFETFGVVLIEALACGKPVVATACGGPEDIITHDNGILVKKNSIDALSIGMRQMIERIDKFESEQIRNDCINKYGEKTVARQLTEVYESCITYNKRDIV